MAMCLEMAPLDPWGQRSDSTSVVEAALSPQGQYITGGKDRSRKPEEGASRNPGSKAGAGTRVQAPQAARR